MKKILMITAMLVVGTTLLSGCGKVAENPVKSENGNQQAKTTITETAKGKMEEAKQHSKILTIQTTQELIKRTIEQLYFQNVKLPSQEEVEERLGKKLSDLKVSMKVNPDKTVTIKNEDPQFTKEQVPDVVLKLDN